MRDRVITKAHFDYANKFVKILGFCNLSDYGKHIPYANLKYSQDDICESLNKTIDIFKALFPLDSFNLRKIHYEFKNIDQVIGFFKKVMTYLSIPYEMIRVRGAFYLRLIQPKTFLYNEYIYNMQQKREMPENKFGRSFFKINDDVTTSLPKGNEIASEELKNILLPKPNNNNPFPVDEPLGFKEIIETLEKDPVQRSVIINKNAILSEFTDFSYFTTLELCALVNGEATNLPIGCEIFLTVGGQFLTYHVVENENKPYIFELNFPNSHFFMYHKLILNIKGPAHTLYNIVLNGWKTYTEWNINKPLVLNHDPKYYDPSINFEWRILAGMVNCSIYRNSDKIPIDKKTLQDYFNENKVTTAKYTYTINKTKCPNNESIDEVKEFLGLNVNNDDYLSTFSFGLMLLIEAGMYKPNNTIYDFVQTNKHTELKFSHVENIEDSDMCILYYPIDRTCDAIGKIEFKKPINQEVALDFYNNFKKTDIGIINSNNKSINFKNCYYLLNKKSNTIFLRVHVDKHYIYELLDLDIIIGEIYYDTEPRRHIYHFANYHIEQI